MRGCVYIILASAQRLHQLCVSGGFPANKDTFIHVRATCGLNCMFSPPPPPEVCNKVEQSYHPADNGGLKLYKEHDEVRWMSLTHAGLLRSCLCLPSLLSCGKLMIRCPEEILENRNANPAPPPMIPLGRVWSC